MPITDAFFVKGNISLEGVCELYHKLRYYEEESSAFIHAKKHGVYEGYNKAIEELPRLIAKTEKHDLDTFYPSFKDCVEKLKIVYGLS